jgi:chemotaxis protein MotB
MTKDKVLLFVLSFSLLSEGCITKSEHLRQMNELQGRLTETEQAKAKLAKQLEALDKENADMKRRVDELSGDIGKAQRDKEAMMQDLAAMKRSLEDLRRAQAAAEKRAKAFRDLVAKFKAMMDSGKLQVEIRNGLMLVKLPDNILFDPGKAELKKEGMDAMAQVTKILIDVEGRKFQVAGHTDNRPIKSAKYRSNWDLSTARALTVVELMIKEGMDARRLSAAGYADSMPVDSNDTDDGRRKNRRIEIVLVPNIEDLPAMDESKS